MSDNKIVVPYGMLKAAGEASNGLDPCGYYLFCQLQKALEWLSENPIVPDDDFVSMVMREHSKVNIKWACCEWQRRMFLPPEPEVPAEVKDIVNCCHKGGSIASEDVKNLIVEAFRRGRNQQSPVWNKYDHQ